MKKNITYAILLFLFVLAVPLLFSDFGINLTAEIYIMAIFAMSLGLIMGFAGMVSLGHAAFFGIGAYTVALVGQYVPNTYLLLIIAVAISGILALITGAVFIRTSKFYFLMITLAFSQLVFTLFWQMKDLTGGADGMSVSAIMNLGFGDILDPRSIYYVMGIAFVLAFILLRILEQWDISSRRHIQVKNLSYGEQRLLEVLLAMASKPKILLLDEPTSGMSPAETTQTSEMIQKLPRSIALVVIEHDMEVVFAIADRITVLHHGEAILSGTPEEIRNNELVKEIYFGGGAKKHA